MSVPAQNLIMFIKVALGDMAALSTMCEQLLHQKVHPIRTLLAAVMGARELFTGTGECVLWRVVLVP